MGFDWGQLVKGVKQFPLHPGQSVIMRAEQRFVLACAGTGGGKTVTGPLWILKQIKRLLDKGQTKINGLVVAPTYPVMERATAPTLISTFEGTTLEGRWIKPNKYVLPRDMGIIWLLSADNPHGLEGGQFDFGWLDEGGQIKYDSWVAIQGRLGQKRAPCLITTTPYGQNWLFHRFFKYARMGDPDYFVHQFPSIANPAYPREEYERAKRTMSAQRFAMRYQGEFIKLAGLVMPDIDGCFRPSHNFPIPKVGYAYGGIDWGWNDPFACLVGKVDSETDILYIYYERYKRMTPLPEHAKAIPQNAEYWAGSDRPDYIEEMRKTGLTVRQTEIKSVQLQIDAINNRIYSDRVIVSDACRALKSEAQFWRYPEKDDETAGEKPVDGNDHACEAFRYLVGNLDRHTLGQAA